MPRPCIIFGVICCFLLFIFGSCSAEATHESLPQTVASLESLLKTKISSTQQQAAKDYEVAHSIFQSAIQHRSKGIELYSKGFDMRRKALLQARDLVHELALAGLGADSRAAVRDLNTISSLARRIAAIATSPKPASNSKHMVAFYSEAAARARDRFLSYNHKLDGSMLAHPEGHFTQSLFHAEMLCARGEIYKALADREDASGKQLKLKASALALQVKHAEHRIQMLSGKPSADALSPGAKKIISLARHESARDSIVVNYLLHKDGQSVLASSSGRGASADEAKLLTSDLRKQDALEARDERRHLDVDVDYGKVPKRRFTLADSLVKFSHRLAASDTSSPDSQTASPHQARAPIPLGTDDQNRAAFELARESSPDDQVDLAAGQASDDSY